MSNHDQSLVSDNDLKFLLEDCKSCGCPVVEIIREEEEDDEKSICIRCKSCGCQTGSYVGESSEEVAINIWNSRYEQKAVWYDYESFSPDEVYKNPNHIFYLVKLHDKSVVLAQFKDPEFYLVVPSIIGESTILEDVEYWMIYPEPPDYDEIIKNTNA